MGLRVPGGGQHPADDLVVGEIAVERVTEPVVEAEGVDAVGAVAAFVPQQRRPFRGEVVGIVGAGDEPIDESVALVGRVVSKKGADLIGRRQPPRDVDRRPPDEGAVVAHRRRRKPEAAQPIHHGSVNEIAFRQRRRHRQPLGKERPEEGHLPLKPDHHRRFPRPAFRRHQPRAVDGGQLCLVRFEHRQARHVTLAAVAVVADHGQLLPTVKRHLALLGDDADAFDHRVVGTPERHPLADPADQQLALVRILGQPSPATVRKEVCRLRDQEGELGIGGKDPPAARLVDEEGVVLGRLEAEEREAEAVLPVRLPVAATGVAAEPGEDRNDLIGKADGELLSRPFDAQGERR